MIRCLPFKICTLDSRNLPIALERIYSPNETKVVQNEGMANGNFKGNLYVRFNVKFPKTLSTEQRQNVTALLS